MSSCVMAQQNYKQQHKGEDGTGGYGEHHREENTCGAWTRIEEPTRYCIGFLKEEREEEDRGRTAQRRWQ